MKEQYKDLALIIETPTQEAWNKVTDTLGIKWSAEAKWEKYGRETGVASHPLAEFSPKHTFGTFEKMARTYINHEKLTYPEFENRFFKTMNINYEKLNYEEVEMTYFLEKITMHCFRETGYASFTYDGRHRGDYTQLHVEPIFSNF